MLYRHPNFQFIYKRPWTIKKAYLSQKGFFRRLAYASSAVLLIASLAALNILLLPRAHAAGGFNASDVLGQMDGTFNPVFNTSNPNNVPVGNFAGNYYSNGTVVDPNHHLLFVSGGCNFYSRVLAYQLDNTNHLTSYHASYVLGEPDFTSCGPYIGGGTSTEFCDAMDMAYDSVHNRLFVADECLGRVMVFDMSSGVSSGMAASWVLGQPNFTAGSGPNCTQLNQSNISDISSLAYDTTDQYLFTADDNCGRTLVFDLSG